MTRDFNKQQRDDRRPSSREQSSNRYRDERFPRPARPHLNRESVDRAWESGAPSRHADYRTRNNNGNRGQAPRNNWHNEQQNGPRRQNREGGQYPTRNSRPSYGDRPASPRRFDNTSNSNQGYQRNPARPFNSDRFDRPNRPYENSRSGSPSRGSGTRPEYGGQSRPYERRSSYRSNEQGNGFQRRNTDYNERDERGPRQFERNHHEDAGNYNRRPTRGFDRDRRAPGNTYRDTRPPWNPETGNPQNPRWQSRPFAQKEGRYRHEEDDVQSQPGSERYEGDYERFNDAHDQPKSARRNPGRYENSKPRRRDAREHREQQSEGYERPVTKLPDGRVLKGPRQAQRKNADFWTDIADNTDSLLDGVHEAEEAATPQQQEADEQSQTETKKAGGKAKPRNRATSAAARSKKARTKQAKTNGPAPRPSKRGFKWPTP